jgi:hypothetical protein
MAPRSMHHREPNPNNGACTPNLHYTWGVAPTSDPWTGQANVDARLDTSITPRGEKAVRVRPPFAFTIMGPSVLKENIDL